MEKKRKKPSPVNQSDIAGAGQQTSMGSSTSESERRSKRFKSSSATNICVICGSVCKTIKQTKVHQLFRVCEKQRAQKLLNAARFFKDQPYTHTASMHGPEDVFAADIYYHSYCCRNYFNRYDGEVEEILKGLEEEDSVTAGDELFKEQFLALGLDFTTTAHSLTSIRDQMNENLPVPVSNRAVKHLIIELYGDSVCFTYPTNKRISQMVYSVKSNPASLLESLRQVSPTQQVASQLAHELKDYKFGLEQSFCEPRDLQISTDVLLKNPPAKWEEFCSFLFKDKQIPQVKRDVVFQILHYMISGGKEPTPFHVMIAEGIHSLTRSKELVTALNRHGICVGYNTVKRIDVDIAEQIISTAGDNRIPLPPVLESSSPLNGAMDNFDRNESTLAGTGSTHDTILVLFQNVPANKEKPSDESVISTRPFSAQSRSTVKLRSKVLCQQLIRMGAMKQRGEIGDNFEVSESVNPYLTFTETTDPLMSERHRTDVSGESESPLATSNDTNTSAETLESYVETADEIPTGTATVTSSTRIDRDPVSLSQYEQSMKSIRLDYFLWLVNRLSQKAAELGHVVPGFTALRSSTVNLNFHATTKILTPILPYPATTYDAILTTMINFQDALKQKDDSYGGLWADEGVYRIAKEIQLLKPDQFSNIFLGLGGFHMEKIVLACLGAYLEPSGIFSVLVETECYGPDTINSVISGSHYSRSRTAHSMIHEVLISMMFEAFREENPEKEIEFGEFMVDCQSNRFNGEVWNATKKKVEAMEDDFGFYLQERHSKSKSFAFWNTYVSQLYPVARDLTNSMRSGDWRLYLSAVERATSLFFFFGRTNYCRWTPLFLQDCYQLKDKFPLLYESYMNGGFVMNCNRKGSGVPFDQALEQCYNRPAKVSGGIIGVTRKKDAVALWDITKHKKDQYVHLLKMQEDVEGELSLHHDFNQSTAKKISTMVQEIDAYLRQVCGSMLYQDALKNVVTGEIVTEVNVDLMLRCMKEGSDAYAKFIQDRLRSKTTSIHSTISRMKLTASKKTSRSTSKLDIKEETIKALMYVEYARHRGFTAEEVLLHEITSSAFFLVDKDGFLKKSTKSQLGSELLKLCPEINPKEQDTGPSTNAYIIDFMALVRKVPLKKLEPPVKTFHDLALALTAMITNIARNCEEIHIVFDTYKEDSIKNVERKRRGKFTQMVVLDVISPNQKVPVVLENFWASSVSKTSFQVFYVEWLTTNYKGSKVLYLGISPKSWHVSNGHASPFARLDCTHEEADDRMMYHIQDILCHRTNPTTITLLSGDTDVFVSLLYHFSINWKQQGLIELWLIRNSGVKRSILPLHAMCSTLKSDLLKCLPALHALTGCDTTSKISTKLSAVNNVLKPDDASLILNFDCQPLTETAMEMAELFLVKCLKPSTDLETFDQLRLAAFDSNALKLDFEKTACTSANARKHIQRSYYQMQLWIQAPFRDASMHMNAESYGFERIDGELVPEIVISKPDSLPDPCKCAKCARKNVCPCRVAGIKCCKYCKCKCGEDCKNPITE